MARALSTAGVIDSSRGLHAAALARLEQARALTRSLDDERLSLEIENEIGWALYGVGEDASALQLFEENLEHARRLEHRGLVNRALAGICHELVATADSARAEPLANELYALTRDTEDIWIMSAADHFLADCAMYRQDYTLAERHRLAALERPLISGDVLQQTSELLGIAFTAAGLGRHEDAIHLEGAVDAKCEELGILEFHTIEFVRAWRRQTLGPAREALGEARAEAAFNEGRTLTLDQAIELAGRGTTAPASSQTNAALTLALDQ